MPAGLSPGGGDPPDESYSLVVEDGRVLLLAAEPVGVARGLTTLIQLVAAAPSASADEIRVPGARILDAPRYAWRGLSLDVARTFFTVEEIRRVVDLLELYKLNVLHLHLTDDQAWRLAFGQPAASGRSASRAPARSPAPPSTATKTSPNSPVTPRTASSRSCPRSTRPGTPPRCWGCGRT